MALTFPLALDQFADDLRLSAVVFDLADERGVTGLRSGQILTYEMAPRLWTGTATLSPGRTMAIREVSAVMRRLQDVSTSFLLYDPSSRAPAGDPSGVVLGSATPQVDTLDANNREMKIKGLPVGYSLRPGDMLTIDQTDHLALHQIVVGGVADGAGVTPLIEVVPHIRTGAEVNDDVFLAPAYCRAMIVPGSVRPATHEPGEISRGVAFEFVQVLD
jgi:hypothetical protein